MRARIEVDRHFILDVRIRFSLQAVLEALEFFKKRPDLFDLVITDQTMQNLVGNVLEKK